MNRLCNKLPPKPIAYNEGILLLVPGLLVSALGLGVGVGFVLLPRSSPTSSCSDGLFSW